MGIGDRGSRNDTTLGPRFGHQSRAHSAGEPRSLTAGRIGAELSQHGAGGAAGAYAFKSAELRFRNAEHTAPRELSVTAPVVRTLRPGELVDEILYPAEHVTIEEYRFSVAPLFCRTPGAVDRAIFQIVVPVLQSGGWRTVRISAERIDRARS